MIPSEYILAVPALALVWPCITLAVLFGCVQGIAAQALWCPPCVPIGLHGAAARGGDPES
ncbi:MAG: hypothetical protein ACREFP_02590 [Acetobacteraceae bacterium]